MKCVNIVTAVVVAASSGNCFNHIDFEGNTIMNPWHDLRLGHEIPHAVTAVVEIPKGSKVKYELDKESGLMRVSRVLYSSVQYPANYGFIPQTLGTRKDPLDVLILGQEPFVPLALVKVFPIGALKVKDEGKVDYKIIAVHAHDPEYNGYKDVSELPGHRLEEIKGFFKDYQSLEKKKVNVSSYSNAQQAKMILMRGVSNYKKTFKKKISPTR